MARGSVLRVQTNQTLRAVDFRHIGELWDFQIICIREMGLISRQHVTLPGSMKLGIAVTVLSILEGNIFVAVCTWERGVRWFGIGWD